MEYWNIILTVTLALIIALIIFSYSSKPCKTYLILGLSGSGKTTLWRSKSAMAQSMTVTSLKTNICKVGDDLWIDVPGHEKLWQSELSKLKISGKLIIYFLIDATTFARNRKEVSMRLYQTCNILAKYKTSVTVKIMQQDNAMSLEQEKIKILVDRELDDLRSEKANIVDLDQESQSDYQELDICFDTDS